MPTGTSTIDDPPASREGRRQSTRARIADASLSLFAERGFEETTVDDIARAAGVSRATVFRAFASKDDIIFADQERLLERLVECLRLPITLAEALVLFAELLDATAEDLAPRAPIVAANPRLVARFAAMRGGWDGVIASELADRAGRPRTFEDDVRAAVAATTIFSSFLSWAVVPAATFTELVQRAIDAVPATFDEDIRP